MKALRAPFSLFALPALLIALAPGWSDAWLLRPEALRHGEAWRLWSGHWVHLSWSHLAWNLALVLAAGWRLEQLHPGLTLRHTLLAAPVISVAIVLGEPGMQSYGGLSGLAAGLIVLLGVQLILTRTDFALGTTLLALVGAKLIGDTMTTAPLFVHLDTVDVRSSPTAHFAGALGALMHAGWLRLSHRPLPSCSPSSFRSPS